MFDYSLHTGDQTSAENSPSDKDFTFSDTEDCGEDSQEIEPEKIVKLMTNPRPRSDARYSLRRHVQPPSWLMCVNVCPTSGRASSKRGSDVNRVSDYLYHRDCFVCVDSVCVRSQVEESQGAERRLEGKVKRSFQQRYQ